MMLVEGVIAMAWAAGAMVVYNTIASKGINTPATLMVGEISRKFMGNVGGIFAVISVIILPITSGDTAFKALRLMVSEQFNIDQKVAPKRILLSILLFIPAVAILYYAKTDANGFNKLWRYFGFSNQLTGVFALLVISVYLKIHKKNFLIGLIPGSFYTFIVTSYIMHADLGFKLDERLGFNGYQASYAIGALAVIFFIWFVQFIAKKNSKLKEFDEDVTKSIKI